MAFPNTPLIDDFNRASLGANYTTLLGTPTISSNQLAASVAPAVAYYNVFQVTDGEAWCQIPTLPGIAANFDLGIRLTDAGSIATVDGYVIRFTQNVGTDTLSLIRITNAAVGATLATFNQEVAAGDYIGIRAFGTLFSAYYRSGSTGFFTLLGSATDATYASGFLSFTMPNTTIRIDNFGGGAYAPMPATQRGKYIPYMQPAKRTLNG